MHSRSHKCGLESVFCFYEAIKYIMENPHRFQGFYINQEGKAVCDIEGEYGSMIKTEITTACIY